MKPRPTATSILAGSILGSSAVAQDVSVLVIEASGAMWNSMEGNVSRIEVARGEMADDLAARDAATPLAVRACGHRRRGDCGDIEVVAPTGLQDRKALADRIGTLNPLAEKATVGTELQVEWTRPDAEGDGIALAPPEAGPDGSVERTLTRWGSPATLRLPDETGAYELRYVQADPLRILAARPLALVAGAAAIEDPGMVVPSERFEVVWSGPAGQGDEIVLAEPDMADDERITATQTRWGSPSRLKAPDTPGRYELRYRVRASGRILTRQSVIVGEPE
ncbi:hypothetical protein ACRDNQ_01905 [Palleronia sp. KMU-117]|uniref:hypothetical protein n=1 Tax=Palleronia sp. KMU-117 TaxID=3434108 RepID=UPI003D747645